MPIIYAVKRTERLVVTSVGGGVRVHGPGMVAVVPLLQRATLVSLETKSVLLPSILFRNGKSFVSGGCNYYVSDPVRAAEVDINTTVYEALQDSIVKVAAKATLDVWLRKRHVVEQSIAETASDLVSPFGIEIDCVRVKETPAAQAAVQELQRVLIFACTISLP